MLKILWQKIKNIFASIVGGLSISKISPLLSTGTGPTPDIAFAGIANPQTIPPQVVPEPTTPETQVNIPETPKITVLVAKAEFNRNNIISDDDFLNTPAGFNTQKFLEKYGSVLATKKFDGIWASEIIDQAREFVSARLILTKLEKEFRLIREKEAYLHKNAFIWSMGYSCGDDFKWNSNVSGFKKQVLLGAGSLRSHFDNWADKYVGKDISKQFIKWGEVKDGVVIPENRATTCLYRYTNYIGERDQIIGKIKYTAPFGNFYFWRLWQIFFGETK